MIGSRCPKICSKIARTEKIAWYPRAGEMKFWNHLNQSDHWICPILEHFGTQVANHSVIFHRASSKILGKMAASIEQDVGNLQ